MLELIFESKLEIDNFVPFNSLFSKLILDSISLVVSKNFFNSNSFLLISLTIVTSSFSLAGNSSCKFLNFVICCNLSE